jgi:hypothetical protein
MRFPTTRSRRLTLAAIAWSGLLLAASTLAIAMAAPSAPVRTPQVVRGASAPSLSSIGIERPSVPNLDGVTSASHEDRRLGRIVTSLAHRRTKVYCYSSADWNSAPGSLGPWRAFTRYQTKPKPTLVLISPEICTELTTLAESRTPVWREEWPDALARSVGSLAHEAAHVSGIRDEAKADCYALQWIGRAARMLRRTRREGAFLATIYLKHWRPWLRPPYVSRECRSGGKLDLHPQSSRWP